MIPSSPTIPLEPNPEAFAPYLAIEGNIGAGKTTLAQLLSDHYKLPLVLENFSDNPFLAKFYEDAECNAFPAELHFLSDRFEQLNNWGSNPDAPSFISDYLYVKTWLFARKTLQDDELALFERLYTLLSRPLPLPDRLVYIHRPIEVLLDNIQQRGREMEQHISTDYLQQIERTYLDYFNLEKRFPILILDLGDHDFSPTDYDVERLIALVERPLALGPQVVKLVD